MNEASHRKTLGKEIGKLYQLIVEKNLMKAESKIFCHITWTLPRGNPSWQTASSINHQRASTFEEILAIWMNPPEWTSFAMSPSRKPAAAAERGEPERSSERKTKGTKQNGPSTWAEKKTKWSELATDERFCDIHRAWWKNFYHLKSLLRMRGPWKRVRPNATLPPPQCANRCWAPQLHGVNFKKQYFFN